MKAPDGMIYDAERHCFVDEDARLHDAGPIKMIPFDKLYPPAEVSRAETPRDFVTPLLSGLAVFFWIMAAVVASL